MAPAARADTLDLHQYAGQQAVAEMSRRYGVSIVFRSAVNSSRPVTFSVDDAGHAGRPPPGDERLANALDMDFQKVYRRQQG